MVWWARLRPNKPISAQDLIQGTREHQWRAEIHMSQQRNGQMSYPGALWPLNSPWSTYFQIWSDQVIWLQSPSFPTIAARRDFHTFLSLKRRLSPNRRRCHRQGAPVLASSHNLIMNCGLSVSTSRAKEATERPLPRPFSAFPGFKLERKL